MDCGEIPPPVIQVQNVSFRYKDGAVCTMQTSCDILEATAHVAAAAQISPSYLPVGAAGAYDPHLIHRSLGPRKSAL